MSTEAAANVPERMEKRSALPPGEALTEAQARRLTQWLPSRQDMIKRCWSGKAGRVRFLDKEGKPGAPLQGQTVLYFGNRRSAFVKAFQQLGSLCFLQEAQP